MSIADKIRRLPYLLLFFGLAAWSVPASAQNTAPGDTLIRRMNLLDVLHAAEEGNFQIKLAKRDIELTRSQYRQTNAAFLPQVTLEETAVSTNDPLNVFGFKLKQEEVSTPDFNPALLNAPDPYQNFNTKLQVRQPLFNPDQLYRRSATRNQLHAADEQLQGTRYYARFQVTDTYYQLLLADEQLSVVNTALKAARENEKQANDFFAQGMISKADYLAAAVRVRDLLSQQSQAENRIRSVQENLRFLLGIEETVVIEPTDSLQISPVSTDFIPDISIGQNSSVKAMQYRVRAARKMLTSSKLAFAPRLNLFGSYAFNDDVLLGSRGESFMLGASLKWNLFSGFSQAGKIMQSRAALKKAEVAYRSQSLKTRKDIQQTRRSIRQARKQYDYASASVNQVREDLRIRSDRYRQGMEKTYDLLQAEARLSRARLQRLSAIYQYNAGLARLEMLLEQNLIN